MAKIRPIEIISSMSGKVCSHADMYFATNKKTGAVHTGKLCNPSTAAPTAGQILQRANFKARAQAVSDWLDANKPSAKNGEKGTEAYQKMMAGYDAQNVIGQVFGYCSKVLVADGTIKVEVPEVEKVTVKAVSSDTVKGSVAPESKTVLKGEGVTLTATANEGYKFSKWDDGNASNPRSVTAEEDKTFTAVFESEGDQGQL